jgi:signal transduction histidine kinase
MGGVSLIVAYTYNLQKETEQHINLSRNSVSEAKEMENELTAIKGLTYTYLVNKSKIWLDSLQTRQRLFVVHLERARQRANTDEEKHLISQISALYSNYEQNVIQAVSLYKQDDLSKANALLAHSAQDLLTTIQKKSNRFIDINKKAENFYEIEWRRTNAIILKILIWLGIGGIAAGLTLGWLISRKLFRPINQLVLKIRDASGEAVYENISFQHGSEFQELEQRVIDLIDRINRANEDISKNKELLQHSNKFATLGKIAPTIAHEIRNPLASIKMLVYSIREESSLPQTIREDLDIISKEIDRMEKFTKDFLRFAKPADPIFAIINPIQGLNEVIKLLNPRIKKNNIQLFNRTENCSAKILADEGHLKQLYMNIILNAVEVMPNGGELSVDFDISTSSIHGSNDIKEFLILSFSDTGPGIPDAILKSIFEPFIRGTDQGVGIGLSISQEIAKSHGGWITAENFQTGIGAKFSIFLPLAQTE